MVYLNHEDIDESRTLEVVPIPDEDEDEAALGNDNEQGDLGQEPEVEPEEWQHPLNEGAEGEGDDEQTSATTNIWWYQSHQSERMKTKKEQCECDPEQQWQWEKPEQWQQGQWEEPEQ